MCMALDSPCPPPTIQRRAPSMPQIAVGFVLARPDGDKNLQKYRKLVQSGTHRSALVYVLESQFQRRGNHQSKRLLFAEAPSFAQQRTFCASHYRCYMKSIASGLFQSAMIFTLALAVAACALLEPRPPRQF